MSNLQLTTDQKHYVNANGDRCEAALLGGEWIAFWEDEQITLHEQNGKAYQRHDTDEYNCEPYSETKELIERYDITAPFEGWLSDPFEGAPEWAQYAIYAGYYQGKDKAVFCEAEPKRKTISHEPHKRFGEVQSEGWELPEGRTEVCKTQYIGDWRNSLTQRED